LGLTKRLDDRIVGEVVVAQLVMVLHFSTAVEEAYAVLAAHLIYALLHLLYKHVVLSFYLQVFREHGAAYLDLL
jgi:hypothetical protein